MEVYPLFEFESQEDSDRAIKDHLGQGQGLRFLMDVHKTTISGNSADISAEFEDVHRKLIEYCKSRTPTDFNEVKRNLTKRICYKGLFGNFNLATGDRNWRVDICYKRAKKSRESARAYFYHPWKDIVKFLGLTVGDKIIFEWILENKIDLIGVYRVRDDLTQVNLQMQFEMQPDEDQNFLTQGMLSAMDIANNEDLLAKILVRLPPRSLLYFKIVSKNWLSLISCPHLIATHICCRGTPVSGLLSNNDYMQTPEFQYVPLTHHNPFEHKCPPNLGYLKAPRIKILQSCNGLLLCSSAYQKTDPDDLNYISDFLQTEDEVLLPDMWQYKSRTEYSGFRFYVCNPTTTQYKTLTFPFFETRILALNLAFDPLHSPYFKIVCVRFGFGSFLLNIYDSKTSTWSTSPVECRTEKKIFFREPVFYKGAIHWYSSEGTSYYFDVEKQCLIDMPMPWAALRDMSDVWYFGESGGHLHLVTSANSTQELNVFELKEDYSAWSWRHFVFSDLGGITRAHSLTSVLSIIRAEKEEESEIVLSMLGTDIMIVYCSFSDGTLKTHMRLVPSEHGVAHLKQTYTYRDSFPFVATLSRI